MPVADNDKYTIVAISVLAMCLVTLDHEALGHGGACLAVGGHIALLTSSIFRCDVRSVWIDPAGPVFNLLSGLLALVLVRPTPRRRAGLRLFLILVACFSFYWEAGYVIKAMIDRDGDLYFAGLDFMGEPSSWWRIAAAVAGVGLYAFTMRWSARALSVAWPRVEDVRRVSRIAWVSATAAAAVAAMAYSGPGFANLRDGVLEIGAASFPLLWLGRGDRTADGGASSVGLQQNRATLIMSLVLYAAFIATLGRGITRHGL